MAATAATLPTPLQYINNSLYPTQSCILGNSHGLTVIFTGKYQYFPCLVIFI